MTVLFNNRYEVSDDGRVFVKERPDAKNQHKERRELKQYTFKNGYKEVKLFDGKDYKSITVHKLVALHFVDGYKEGYEVNHKDCNKANNHYFNLEWCSSSQNKRHKILSCGSYGCMKKPQKIKAISEDGSFEIYNSQREAEEQGFNRCSLRKAIKENTKYKGLTWKYA